VSNLKDSLKKKVKGPSAIDVLTSPITGKADQPENEAENESLQGLQGTPGTLDNTVLPSKHDKHELQDKQSKHELPDNNSLQSNHSNTDLLSIQELPNKQSLQSRVIPVKPLPATGSVMAGLEPLLSCAKTTLRR